MASLHFPPPRGRLTFVTGKGGVGKSTTASALALHWADTSDGNVRLLSTDPAPSLRDIFSISENNAPSPCNARLTVEEIDAAAVAGAWIDEARASLEELIEKGTYLESDDVSRLTQLTLPGVDELGAALRITALLNSSEHIIIDTAPTGHTLRLLDTPALLESWAAVFDAMARKVSTMSMMMVNAAPRLSGVDTIGRLRNIAQSFRHATRAAQYVVVTRPDPVVEAETARLIRALQSGGFHVATTVCVHTSGSSAPCRENAGEAIDVVTRRAPAGCDGLREWMADASYRISTTAVARTEQTRIAVSRSDANTRGAAPASALAQPAAGISPEDHISPRATHAPVGGTDTMQWLHARPQQLMWFAGKGGTGKSTCAAAVACELARERNVMLCSTDPAGSLAEVLALDRGGAKALPARLQVQQVSADAELAAWRAGAGADATAALQDLVGSATMDRAILEALGDAVPPGIDELFALAQIVDATGSDVTIIVDAAPTGHFLRLIQSPGIALEWTHAIMRVMLDYGVAARAEGFAARVLAFARQLRHLLEIMADADACGVFVVSTPEPVVTAQTERLAHSLTESDIAIIAHIVNRSGAPDPAQRAVLNGCRIAAPFMRPPPTGAEGLRDFISQWSML